MIYCHCIFMYLHVFRFHKTYILHCKRCRSFHVICTCIINTIYIRIYAPASHNNPIFVSRDNYILDTQQPQQPSQCMEHDIHGPKRLKSLHRFYYTHSKVHKNSTTINILLCCDSRPVTNTNPAVNTRRNVP